MSDDRKIRVGLLFGGRSAEHEISIRSARSVAAAVDPSRFELHRIGIGRSGRWIYHDEKSFGSLTTEAGRGSESRVLLEPGETALRILQPGGEITALELDVIFPVLHGPFGEDGTLQGLLDVLGIPYVGAGVLGSAVGMDKDVQKRLLREAGLPVVSFEVLTAQEWQGSRQSVRERVGRLDLPWFVKPANLGSSVGIVKVSEESDLDAAIETALRYDTKILVERGIEAREIECSVLGNERPEASVPGEIVPGEEFYSYDDKYSAGSSARLLIPAPLPVEMAASVRTLAVRAFRITECTGMARVDFFVERSSGRIYINELNTIPGFTSISMYPKLWEATGLPYPELVRRLIDLALERHAQRCKLAGAPAP